MVTCLQNILGQWGLVGVTNQCLIDLRHTPQDRTNTQHLEEPETT